MPRRAAITGSDKAAGDSTGVRFQFDGDALLSGKNIFDNPDLTRFDADDELEGWELNAPPEFVGWNIYARGPGLSRFCRQNLETLKLDDDDFDLNYALMEAAEPPDPTHRAAVATPDAPELEIIGLDRVGFAAGWYGSALAFTTGNPTDIQRTKITPAGPRITGQCSQGQGWRIGLPATAPEHITGIAILTTAKQTSEANAAVAPLYIQEVVDIRGGIRPSYDLNGPFKSRYPAPTANETYTGAANTYQTVAKVAYANGDLWPIDGFVSFSFKTEFGWSASQQMTYVNTGLGYWNGALYWKPQSLPSNAIAWRPEFQDSQGSWQALGERRPGEWAYIFTNDTGRFYQKPESASRREEATDDETGFKPPDTAPTMTAFGLAAPAPGKYDVRATLTTEDEEESAPSTPPASITIAMGETWRAHKPDVGNILKNPEFSRREPDTTDTERDWERVAGTGVTHGFTKAGRIKMTDTTGATTDQEVRRSVPKRVPGDKVVSARLEANITRWTGGILRVIARQRDNVGTTSDFVVGEYSGVKRRTIEFAFSPGGANGRIPYMTNVREIQMVFVHVGSRALSNGKGGARNFDWELANGHETINEATQRKRHKRPRRTRRKRHSGGNARHREQARRTVRRHGDRVPTKERDMEEEPYPSDSYCVVVENPEDGATQETTYAKFDFEGGTAIPAGLVQTRSPADATTTLAVNTGSAITGDYGLQVRDTGTGTSSQVNVAYQITTGNQADASARVQIWIQQLPQTGTLEIFAIGNNAGTKLGVLRLTTAGTLTMDTVEAAPRSVELVRSLKSGHLIDVELRVTGAGTATGRLRAYVGLHGTERTLEGDLTNAAWTATQAQRAWAGVTAESVASNTYDLRYDNFVISNVGVGAGVAVPGNYIEYWAPHGTPLTAGYGPTGMKVPVKSGVLHCLSAYVEWSGVGLFSDPLVFVGKDVDGRVVQTIPKMLSLVKGWSDGWKRVSTSFTPNSQVAYIECQGGRLAGGRWRFMGFQLETGVGSPTAFSNTFGSSGEVIVNFNMNVPGLPYMIEGMSHMHRVKKISAAGIKYTLEPNTTVTWSVSSSDFAPGSGQENWSTWTQDLTLLPIRQYVRVRAQLANTVSTNTPYVHDLHVEFQRYQAVLCRGDGTEFPGGCQVYGFPPVFENENEVIQEFADNSQGFYTMGTARREATDFGAETYYRSTSEEIMALQGKNNSEFAVEAHGKRHLTRIFNMVFVPIKDDMEDSLHFPETNGEDDGIFQLQATGIAGLVTETTGL